MNWLLWVGGISVAFMAIMVSTPVVLRAKRDPHQTEAIHNLRHLHLALFNFDADYGSFPDAATIADVRSNTHTTLPLGISSSNDYFRQLIATGSAKSERIFWAKTPATPRKPNDVLGVDTLKKGECSFAYVVGLSASDDVTAPVAMTPMVPGTDQFEPTAFNYRAPVLRIDGSARTEPIRTDNGKVAIPGGKTLFDPSAPYWRGKAPDLKWPE